MVALKRIAWLSLSTFVGGAVAAGGVRDGAGSPWDRVGPYNIFDGKGGVGEGGTVASAASPAANHDLIYAGGQNNAASSGVIKTIDGTSAAPHWTRQSKGLWDTRVLGLWIHPDDPTGGHVLCGTHTGVYESHDFAESWTFRTDTAGWGHVASFRLGTIKGVQYVIASTSNGLGTLPISGGKWEKIAAPGPIPDTNYISLADGGSPLPWTTEALVCVGNGGGGKMYYVTFETASTATWSAPITPTGASAPINCMTAAVDPHDRNHFLYVQAGLYNTVWESFDGGKTVQQNPNHNTGVYYVMIDSRGWQYTASQTGAWVSQDKGKTWNVYHVIIHSRTDDQTIDRVPHDYQNIIPEFRGDGVAFPSDQGLHIVDRTSFELISAVGDMHNTIVTGVIISPSSTVEGSRNIVSNIWDWTPQFSRDDGATWSGWNKTENNGAPQIRCGEGGGGVSLGASGHALLFHRNVYWYSSDGGHTFSQNQLEGMSTGAFDYLRLPGSRTEPTGTAFWLMAYGPRTDNATAWKIQEKAHRRNPELYGLPEEGSSVLIGSSKDFGATWTFAPMPGNPDGTPGLEAATGLVVDPTAQGCSLYAVAPDCLAHSVDGGVTWSPCSSAAGLEGRFQQLVIKDSKTMFMMRSGQVPLRTTDGGATWQPLLTTAPLFKYKASLAASISWTGRTLVIHGEDPSAVSRQEFATTVWKSHDDGNTWADETGDLVTISLNTFGHGAVWYEDDFYLLSSGEGICVKRNFDSPSGTAAQAEL